MRNVIHPNEVNEVMNCKMSATENIKPGMAATMFVGSDRYAMVVTEVINDKTIKVAHVYDEDVEKFVENEGTPDMMPDEVLASYIEMENYTPSRGSNWGCGITYTYRKNGRWLPKGSDMWDTCSIHIGKANNYRDPSF